MNIEKKLIQSNFPVRYIDLENTSIDNLSKKNKSALKFFISSYKEGNGLCIISNNRDSLMNFCFIVLYNILKDNFRISVLYHHVFEIPSIYRNNDSSFYKIVGKKASDILVLDDFGFEEGNDKLFWYIVKSRYDHKKSTIFTASSKENLSSKFDESTKKLIFNSCNMVLL